jgi:hypothetical protein
MSRAARGRLQPQLAGISLPRLGDEKAVAQLDDGQRVA